MMDLLAVADALKAVALEVPGVKVAALGINQSWPQTPAAEVILADGDISMEVAGGSSFLEQSRVQIVFYVPLTNNLEADERELIPLLQGFVDSIHDPAFDYTLGGLVENLRAVNFTFTVTARNRRSYRAAALTLLVGEL